MRVVVAPDKFKGTLTSLEAAGAMRLGVLDVCADAEVVLVPLADGGEGTVAAAITAGAHRRESIVARALGDPGVATWASQGSTAFLELAEAAGLRWVAMPSPETAGAASTYGLGELMREAIGVGHGELVIGLGGSASTDGGAGALQALGVRFLDAAGQELPRGGQALQRLASIDRTHLLPAIRRANIRLACDVDNPLIGDGGAAIVYAAQKGADTAMVAELEAGLRRFAEIAGLDPALPGGGAAGGTAAGLVGFLGASIERGIDLVLDLAHFADAVGGADLVLTGEGALDRQSLAGKAPIGVAARARAVGVPVGVVAGRIELSSADLAGAGIDYAVALAELAEDPRDNAAMLVRAAATALIRRWLG